MTDSELIRRAMSALGKRKSPAKADASRVNARKLTPDQVYKIRAIYGKKTQREIAEQFGVSTSLVRWIGLRKVWKDLPER